MNKMSNLDDLANLLHVQYLSANFSKKLPKPSYVICGIL